MARLIHTIQQIRQQVDDLRAQGKRVALVPTMGALHDGHLALVEAASKQADAVLVSIFVNPLQFGPNEDLQRYPRQLQQDKHMLDALAQVTAIFAPSADEMYPKGFDTNIVAGELAKRLCGAARPGHFDGVCTVVTKLVHIIQPDCMAFGEKDFQQLRIIEQCMADLNLPVDILRVPTLRERDGLAMSSRNQYLSVDERATAPQLYATLQSAAEAIARGQKVQDVLAHSLRTLNEKGFDPVDYLALCDEKLYEIAAYQPNARLFVAAYLGSTRLIDNIAV